MEPHAAPASHGRSPSRIVQAGERTRRPDRIFSCVQSFEHTPPEARELLQRRIRDLGLRVEGSPLEPYVQRLYGELSARGLEEFRPGVYLSDEWACPDGEPIIGVPFYLADPKLSAVERAINDLEDEKEIMMYLRHEAGHAFNYAYELYQTKEWLDLFGPFDRPYNDEYTPVPFSRRYVRHISGWYAQKHPDEDFSETFAVWLTPDLDWRRRYRGWPALRKLEYVDRIARELAHTPPRRALSAAVRELPVEEMASTLEEFYRQREEAEIQGLLVDSELEDIFTRTGEELRPASVFLLDHRKLMADKIAYWTGARRPWVKKLLEAIGRRTRELELSVDRKKETEALVEVMAFATTLATNYLSRGQLLER